MISYFSFLWINHQKSFTQFNLSFSQLVITPRLVSALSLLLKLSNTRSSHLSTHNLLESSPFGIAIKLQILSRSVDIVYCAKSGNLYVIRTEISRLCRNHLEHQPLTPRRPNFPRMQFSQPPKLLPSYQPRHLNSSSV
jgi:hypothetical protein